VFDGYEIGDVQVLDDVRIHYRQGGDGAPLLLLHGNPLTHVSWHKLAGPLSRHFRVVAADLRGYGDSSTPEAGPDHANYSFRAMAQDQIALMQHLGYQEFYVAGHDRGARVIHRMCLDSPERILRAALLDIVPTQYIFTHTSLEWALKSWHWTFMAGPTGIAEQMMSSVPARWYMERKLAKPGIGLGPFTPEAFEEYVRCFTPDTIRGSCEDYRAAATCDLTMDTKDLGRMVDTPLLILWGAESHTQKVFGDLLGIWSERASDIRGRAIPACGHYLPEQAPEEVLLELLEFFSG
jgi:haloacetate dehalogenase